MAQGEKQIGSYYDKNTDDGEIMEHVQNIITEINRWSSIKVSKKYILVMSDKPTQQIFFFIVRPFSAVKLSSVTGQEEGVHNLKSPKATMMV